MAEFKGFRNDRLKEVMEKHEVTTEELAKALEVPERFIDTFINEGNYPLLGTDELFVICDTCNCSADYLLGLSDGIN